MTLRLRTPGRHQGVEEGTGVNSEIFGIRSKVETGEKTYLRPVLYTIGVGRRSELL